MEENNKLIAEFMGCTHPFNDLTDATLYSVSHGTFEVDELKYHESWDWLIPVIEKIQDKHLENPELDYWSVDEIRLAIPNIQQVHYLVVEFIKENNKYICGSCGDREYPFNEGDDYYTIEDGEVIWSCWDDISEELHNDNPNKQYFKTKKEAENYNKNN